MGYDADIPPGRPPENPAGLTDQQRQMLDAMRGAAENLRDDCDFLAGALVVVTAASAPTPQLLDLARRAAFKLVRCAATAEGTGRGVWNALATDQQASPPAAQEPPPAPAAPSEQPPTPSPTDAPAAGALYQRRGVS